MPALLALALGCSGPHDSRSPPDDTDRPGDSSDTAHPIETDAPSVFNGCTNPLGERAEGGHATPIVVDGLFTDQNTTLGGESRIDSYACAPDTAESGPERVYALSLPYPAQIRIDAESGEDVDVDVHLMRGDTCVARDDTSIEADVDAGDYLVIVDTYARPDGTSRPGGYSVGIEAWPADTWVDTDLGDGLVYRHFRGTEGDAQSFHVLSIAPSREIAPIRHDGCETVGSVGDAQSMRAGVNGGFFESCAPLDFGRRDGETWARISASFSDEQRVLAWDDGQPPEAAWVARGDDYTAHGNAVGSWPSLVQGGSAHVEPDTGSSFFTDRHPRTAIGRDPDGNTLFVVADGRSETGSGLTMYELADLLVDLGATDAMNLDGGGSSTMWIPGCAVDGYVNRPSDGAPRAVSDGVYAQ